MTYWLLEYHATLNPQLRWEQTFNSFLREEDMLCDGAPCASDDECRWSRRSRSQSLNDEMPHGTKPFYLALLLCTESNDSSLLVFLNTTIQSKLRCFTMLQLLFQARDTNLGHVGEALTMMQKSAAQRFLFLFLSGRAGARNSPVPPAAVIGTASVHKDVDGHNPSCSCDISGNVAWQTLCLGHGAGDVNAIFIILWNIAIDLRIIIPTGLNAVAEEAASALPLRPSSIVEVEVRPWEKLEASPRRMSCRATSSSEMTLALTSEAESVALGGWKRLLIGNVALVGPREGGRNDIAISSRASLRGDGRNRVRRWHLRRHKKRKFLGQG
ncbi:hypothetical protein KCU61_g231, partial [Aureobasidium melanogenum]